MKFLTILTLVSLASAIPQGIPSSSQGNDVKVIPNHVNNGQQASAQANKGAFGMPVVPVAFKTPEEEAADEQKKQQEEQEKEEQKKQEEAQKKKEEKFENKPQFDDDINKGNNDDHGSSHGGGDDDKSKNLCTQTCQFPITGLNLTGINEVAVGRFLVDPPSLDFWLNYTCPEGVTVERLRIGRKQGLSHLRYEHVPPTNSTPGQGGFHVKLWGTFDLIGKTSEWNIGLRQPECDEERTSLQFLTTNPLNLTKPQIKLPNMLTMVNCTGGTENVTTGFNVNMTSGGEFKVNFANQIVAIEMDDAGFEIQSHQKGTKNKTTLQIPKNLTVDNVYTLIPGLPANVSFAVETVNGSTLLKFKVDGNQTDVNGTMCLGFNIGDNSTMEVAQTGFVAMDLGGNRFSSSLTSGTAAISVVLGSSSMTMMMISLIFGFVSLF